MTIGIRAWRSAAWLIAGSLICGAVPASAQGLQAGEYTCAGSSGILIGLGFKLRADGTYTDLDNTTSGRVSFEGSTVRFIGGHLTGQVGTLRGNRNFDIRGISCSRN